MKDTEQLGAETSEEALISSLRRLVDAGISVIQIKSREPARTLEHLRKHITTEEGSAYREFDVIQGTRTGFSGSNYYRHELGGENDGDKFLLAMKHPLAKLEDIRKGNLLLHCVYNVPVQLINNNLNVTELLELYCTLLPGQSCVVIIVTGEEVINLQPGLIHVLKAPTPNEDELEKELRAALDKCKDDYENGIDIDDSEFRQLARLGLGMTLDEFRACVYLAIVDTKPKEHESITMDPVYRGISKGKTAVVNQSDILELQYPESMDNVAGLEGLKAWVEERKDAFSEEARAFGLQPPKAVALVGVPGTGKSLVAKAIASTLQVPLLRLDFGRIFSKFVGDSESRMRSALDMITSMGQVVVFVDEIDKGLGGLSGGGMDSGVSSRVLGSFLTWMQENNSGALCVVTANKIDGLPPELFRKGRMDQTFSVGVPDSREREAALAVHLRLRGRDIGDLDRADIDAYLQASDRFVPAEVEQTVKDALVIAYNDKSAEDLEGRHLIAAASRIVPMAKSHAAQIEAIEEWAKVNAVPANGPAEPSMSSRPAAREVRRDSARPGRVVRPRRVGED